MGSRYFLRFFSGIFLFLLGCSFSPIFLSVTFAENTKNNSPFSAIDKKITTFANEISASGKGKCVFKNGNQMETKFKKNFILPSTTERDLKEKKMSTCYRESVKILDEKIQSKILDVFPYSKLACEELAPNQAKLNEIMEMRDSLTSKDLPKEFTKEHCPQDKRSQTFAETLSMLEQIKKKIKEVSSFFNESKKGEDGKSEETKKKNFSLFTENKNITAKANARANAFVNDFIQSSIILPLYQERSAITGNLKGLANGKSTFKKVKSISFIDLLNPLSGEKVSSKDGKKVIAKNAEEIVKKDSGKDAITHEDFITNKKDTASSVNQVGERMKQDAKNKESSLEFIEASTKTKQDILQPIGESVDNTSNHLKGATKNLGTTLQKQNINN